MNVYLLHFLQHLLIRLAVILHDRHSFSPYRHGPAGSVFFAFQCFDTLFQQSGELLAFSGIFPSFRALWKSHATLTLLATQDLPTFGYNMIDPLKSWCWGSILFYPFKINYMGYARDAFALVCGCRRQQRACGTEQYIFEAALFHFI